MPFVTHLCSLLAAALLFGAARLSPQVAHVGSYTEPRIRFSSSTLRLDGSLDEPAWRTADSVVDLTQRDPTEGAPSSEGTIVRFLGTSQGLWVGIWANDREPSRIVRAQLRRDADLESDDHVTLMLSPTGDGRTGYLFAVNANGAMYDAEITSFEDERSEWDGIWDTRAQVTSDGWRAEILIPWQSLRYDAGTDGWRVNIGRFIRRKNESSLWRSWRRSEGIRFLDRAGIVRGFTDAPATLSGGLPRRAIVELRPYVTTTGRLTERRFEGDIERQIRGAGVFADAGVDAKLAPSPTLTLDLTVNADFAQAEVDRQVVNLTRFPEFFPEQRAFFTEGMGIFEFGREEQTMLFYSRRIGLSDDGTPIPLLGGARLTGRIGRQQVGFLTSRTGGDERSTDLVARIRRDVLANGYVGAMATFRDRALLEDDSVHRAAPAAGADFNLPFEIADRTVVLGGAIAVDGGRARGDPTHSRIFAEYPNDEADISIRLDRMGEGYEPALGFVQQNDVLDFGGQFELTPRPDALGPFGRPLKAMGVRRLMLMPLDWRHVRELGGSLSHASYEVRPFGIEFESGDEIELNLQRQYDVPTEDFDPFEGAIIPAGRYRWDRVELGVSTSGARPLAAEFEISNGAFYTGRALAIEGELRARFQPHVLASIGYARSAIRLDDSLEETLDRFTAHEATARVDVAASPRLGTTLFAQWNNEDNSVAVNARLRWTSSPGSDLYVVWTSAWPSDFGRGLRDVPWRRPTGGALIVKYIRYLRL